VADPLSVRYENAHQPPLQSPLPLQSRVSCSEESITVPLTSLQLPSKAPCVPKAQQLPQGPWSRTGVVPPALRQSKLWRVAEHGAAAGMAGSLGSSGAIFALCSWMSCSRFAGGTSPVITRRSKSSAAV